MRSYPRFIIIHHTAYKDSPILELNRFHSEKGWGQVIKAPAPLLKLYKAMGYPEVSDGIRISVGYHYYIRENGKMEKGRPDYMRGAHCPQMEMNRDSIGIALAGNFDLSGNTPSEKQWISLAVLLRWLIKKFKIPKENILIHREVKGSQTVCPGKFFPTDRLRLILDIEHMFDL